MPIVEAWNQHSVDVAVVGAGAAGLAAARHLRAVRPDLSVLVLEARDRIGGRAHTVAVPGRGLPLDLGCGWLHGARTNAWTRIAAQLGFFVDRTPAPWDSGSRELGLGEADRAECNRAVQAYFERLEQRSPEAPDCPMSDLLEPGNRWNGLLDAIGTYINGVELDRASALDFQRYDPGPGPDWRVRDGYGHLVACFGAAAPVMLQTRVTRIDHGGAEDIRLDTSRGTLAARNVIVAVPTDILAGEAIRLVPPLRHKVEAAANLPLGLADKLFLSVIDPDDLPIDGNLIGSPYRAGTGGYQVRPFGRPVIECYFGGQLARDLERAGADAAVRFASDELVAHFGSGIRRRLGLAARSAWAQDPHARGSYSYARPGGSDARGVLAEPLDGRLFFAGEACSRQRFSTAHGAYETGIEAAKAIAARLRRA